MKLFPSILAVVFVLPNSAIAGSEDFENAKCSIPGAVRYINEILVDNLTERLRVERKIKKIGASESPKNVARKRNLVKIKEQLSYARDQLRPLLKICNEEAEELEEAKSFEKREGSKCLSQFATLIPALDQEVELVDDIINAELDANESPASPSSWLSKAAEIAKQIAGGAVLCMYFQSAAGLVPNVKTTSGKSRIAEGSQDAVTVPLSSKEVADLSERLLLPSAAKPPSEYQPVPFDRWLLADRPQQMPKSEAWLKEVTEGKVSREYRNFVTSLDAGKLPVGMQSAIQTMQSSLPALLRELYIIRPERGEAAYAWATVFSRRLTEHQRDSKALPDDIYMDFAMFVNEAKGGKIRGNIDSVSEALQQKDIPFRYHAVGDFSDLSIMEINRMQGLRIYPVGLTLAKDNSFDGITSGPLDFADHDYNHGFQLRRAYKEAYILLQDQGLSRDQIEKAFEDTQQAYRDFMTSQHQANPRLASMIEAQFFYMTHENDFTLEPKQFLANLEMQISNPPPFEENEEDETPFSHAGPRHVIKILTGFWPSQNEMKEVYSRLIDFFNEQAPRFAVSRE